MLNLKIPVDNVDKVITTISNTSKLLNNFKNGENLEAIVALNEMKNKRMDLQK